MRHNSFRSFLSAAGISILSLATWINDGQADDNAPFGVITENRDGSETAQISLSNFKGRPATRLVGHVAADKLYFPISPAVEVERAQLQLKATHSTVVQEQSLMMVFLNDMIASQIPLTEKDGKIDELIDLETETIEGSFNELIFQTAAALGWVCEIAKIPQVWVEVNLEETDLIVRYRRNVESATLSELPDYFFPGIGGVSTLHVVTAGEGDDFVRAAGLAVQGAAVQAGFALPRVKHSSLSDWGSSFSSLRADDFMASQPVEIEPESESDLLVDDEGEPVDGSLPQSLPIPQRMAPPAPPVLRGFDVAAFEEADGMLIGTKDDLAPYLIAEVADEITGPYLRIAPIPEVPNRFVLIISGRDVSEVEVAATALGVKDFPMPDKKSTTIEDVDFEAGLIFADMSFLEFDRAYSFDDLGYETDSRKGLSPEPIDINVNLPPDYFASESDDMILSMSYAYGAGMRRDSTLDIEVNGYFIDTIALDNVTGGRVDGYQIPVPLKRFRPGNNVMRLLPKMIPEVTGECLWMQDETLIFTLFDDSELDLANVSRFSEVPDLNLFRINGYPYFSSVETPESAEVEEDFTVMFYTPEPESRSLEALWTLQAKLAQLKGRPLLEAEFTSDWTLAKDAAHLLAISSDLLLPDELAAAVPLPFRSATRLKALPAADFDEEEDQEGSQSFAFERSLQPGDLGRFGAMMAFERPSDSNLMTTLITASSDENLAQRTYDLVQGQIWSQLNGGIFIWEEEPESVLAFGVSKTIQSGEISSWSNLEFWTGKRPINWVLGALGALFVLGVLTWIFFARSGWGDTSNDKTA